MYQRFFQGMIIPEISFFRFQFFRVSTYKIGLLLACFYIGFSPATFSQTKPSATDSLVIDALLDSGTRFHASNPAKSLAYFERAFDESKKIDYVTGIVRALASKADYYYGVNLDKTIEEANNALAIYESRNLDKPALEAEIRRIIADAYDDKGKKDSAAYHYYLLSRQLEENDTAYSPEFEVNVLMKLTVFTTRLNYDTAYLKKTIDQYLLRARKASDQIPANSPMKPSIHFLEGVYNLGMHRYDESAQSFILYLKKMGDNISLPRKLSTYVNIAQAYLEANKPKQALNYIETATAICQQPAFQGSVPFYMSVINLIKGRILFKLDNYQGAIDLINSSLETANQAGTPLQLDAIEGHKVLSEAYAALGNIKKTIEHQNKYIQLHDSVLQKDRMDVVSMLEVRHKVEEKNRQIAQEKLRNVEAQNKLRAQNFWLVLTSCVIIILLLSITLWRRNSLHKQRLQTEKINSIQQRREIDILNAAINGEERERNRIAAELHDGIGGILAAAKMNLEIARKATSINPAADLNRGIELVEIASTDLRKTAHNMMPEQLIQEGLVSAVQYYCDSLSTSANTSINFQLVGTPIKLKPAFELSVYRIIQELLHNILKHAHARQALVQLSYNNNSLAVTVEDDGIGISAAPQSISKPGIGLTSVRQRVQAIKGTIALQTGQNEGTSIYMEFEPELLTA
jgi:two-component system NarL family sensor kinase